MEREHHQPVAYDRPRIFDRVSWESSGDDVLGVGFMFEEHQTFVLSEILDEEEW